MKNQSTNSEYNFFIPEKSQSLVFSISIALLVIVFLWEAISSGGFVASDNTSYASFTNYLKQASESGEFPLWLPNIF